ncbi:hypothetical protein AB4427_12995 [Vibrio artabrorum]|uniref:hypothetical protein n=1 Tax=Vibrio artabrorum TaxID=446374 RepID=UPI00354F0EDC
MLKIKKTGEGHRHPKTEEVSKVVNKEETKRLNADLPKTFYMRVKKYAMENDLSITEMTKLALTDYMDKHE